MKLTVSAISYAWRHSRSFDRYAWIRYTGWLTIIAALAFCLVALRYLAQVHSLEPHAWFYLVCAYIGHFGSLALLFVLPIIIAAVLVPSRVVVLPMSALMLIMCLTLLALDTVVYDQYRFHLNGFVWELITGPGAGEIFHISRLSQLFLLIAVRGLA